MTLIYYKILGILFLIFILFRKKIIVKRLCITLFAILVLFPLSFILTFIFFSYFGMIGAMLSATIIIIIFSLIMFYIWNIFTKKTLKNLSIAVLLVLFLPTSILFGNKIYRDSIIEITDTADILHAYQPFTNNSKVKRLDKESTLKITDNFPRIDGATALYPLYSAFIQATYPQNTTIKDMYIKFIDKDELKPNTALVLCSRTIRAFKNLLDGQVDLIFIAGISAEQEAEATDRGLELKKIPIGREAFIFFVNIRNPISNLSINEIKNIYSGKITNWQEVGGPRNKILAYQRQANSGSQTALLKLMGDTPVMVPPQRQVNSMMSGIYQEVADYKNYKSAIGYSFRFFINGMINDNNNQVKLLSINGVAPTIDNIVNNTYPLSDTFYAVTIVNREQSPEMTVRAENAQKLIDWILSPQGQSLVAQTGYAPLAELDGVE
jgi:phosphate transport system substrate-binding protein